MSRQNRPYVLTLAILTCFVIYWVHAHGWTNDHPSVAEPESTIDKSQVRTILQDLLVSDDTRLLLESLVAPKEEILAHQVTAYLLDSGTLEEMVHEILASAQLKSTIIALVKEPEIQTVIKSSIDLDDVQSLMESILSTPEGQAFIMELLTDLISKPGTS